MDVFRETASSMRTMDPAGLMNIRTYRALLGLGFDTDLIARIDAHGHTVSALGALSKKALLANYSQSDIGLIQERIHRAAIPGEIVDAVLDTSDRVCCFCRDGISSRPFQIHHAVEYSKTQDNSIENLILLCPNHHQTIPKIHTPEEQKQGRAEWYAIVSVVRSYRSKGIAFPFGSFVALDYGSEPNPLALIEGYKLSNATALDLAQTTSAQNAVQRLEHSPFLAIAGQSGSGKSTFARGLIGRFWKRGFAAFQIQPSLNGQAAAEVLTFLSFADRECILLLDDVNVYLSEVDITAIQVASRAGAKVVCTWTRDGAGAPALERHLPDWMLIEWDQLRLDVHKYLPQTRGNAGSCDWSTPG
jgi:HNH endonuclease